MAHDATPVTSIVIITLATMRIWPDNPRKTLGDITDLTRSIRESGVDQPLIVRAIDPPEVVTRDGETFTLTHEVIDGQRRYRAATAAGSLGVPCIVRVLTDAEALEIALRANDQREPVNALEEASAIRLRLDDAKAPCTVEQLADRMGRDRRYILRRLSLLGLCETAQSWLRNGTLPLRHAEALAVLDPATQAAHVGRYKDRDIPPYKAFVRDLSLALTVLNNAPFDVKDAKLVPRAGPCGPCPKNSASQPDLFGGVSDDAHCCDQPCWNAKVEAHWTRETKVAKRKGLAIVEDVIAYGTVTRRDVPYASAEMLPKGHEQPQTAITRSEFGHVIALYDRPSKPKPSREADDSHADDIEPETDDGGESTSAAPRRPSRPERTRAAYVRLLEVLATPEGLRAGLRTALFAAVTEWGGTDLWRCMDVLGLEYHEDTLPEADAAKVPEADVSRVLVTMLVATTLEASPDADMPACERELRAMLASASPKPTTGAEVAESETATHRVLIVPDEGWPKHVKGLNVENGKQQPSEALLRSILGALDVPRGDHDAWFASAGIVPQAMVDALLATEGDRG